MLLKRNRIGIVFYVCVVALPLGAGIVYALLYSFGLIGTNNEGGPTTEHWKAVFSDRSVIYSFAYSTYVAVTALLLAVLSGLYLALGFKRELNRGFFSYLIYFPLAIPAIVTAFFIFQLLSASGIFSRLAFRLHLIRDISAFPDMVNDRYSVGIILAHTLMALPFFTLLFLNLYSSEQIGALKQLALSLGASREQLLLKVTLPILISRAMPNLVLYFLFILGSYEVPLLLGRQSPQMVSVVIIRKLQKFDLRDIPQGYVIALVYTFAVLLVMLLLLAKRKGHYAA
jgi:putative spermidine/putrescine transport system permease protein